jgi:hypothetical protein
MPIMWPRRSMMRNAVFLVPLGLVCLGGGVVAAVGACNLAETPPLAPVYPGSSLIREIRLFSTLASYDYSVAVSSDEIVEFYEQWGYCEEPPMNSNRIVCRGNNTSRGDYFAYIETRPRKSEIEARYTIEIRWTSCSDLDW